MAVLEGLHCFFADQLRRGIDIETVFLPRARLVGHQPERRVGIGAVNDFQFAIGHHRVLSFMYYGAETA